jgi:uncharacterized protein (TIGR03084 family)
VREILSDLVAEQQALDQFLQKVNIREWSKPTPAKGWDIRDHVSHLAALEEYAHNALADRGSRLAELNDYDCVDDFNQVGVVKGRAMRPQDVIEWWRLSRAKVIEALSAAKETDEVPWFHGSTDAKTFAALRLSETWAHALDIHATIDAAVEDTDRLRHIVHAAHAMLPYAFKAAEEDYSVPVRIEGIGIMYAKWVAGPADTDQYIKGSASEFCRVAVQRMDLAEAQNLHAHGEVAEKALRLVRTYL